MIRETADSLELWPVRIQSAIEYFENHPKGYNAWRQAIELYSMNHWRNVDSIQSIPKSDDPVRNTIVPITSSTVDSFLPYLTKKNPKWMFKPQEPSDDTASQLITGL